MKHYSKKTGVAAVLAAMLIGAGANGAQASAAMTLGGETTQPIGHFELCQRMPSECRALRGQPKAVKLNKSLWSRIIDINASVNMMIRPMTDQDMWGKEEVWSYPSATGDCEDYVLMKRRLLMQAGVPESALLITVVRQADGSGHAVLTVATTQGDFVLDNLRGDVRPWNETGYVYLKRQDSANSGRWVTINDGRSVETVAALR